MGKKLKPTIVPTLRSAKTAAWGALLVGAFFALLMLYLAYGRLAAAERRLATPVRTEVASPFGTVKVPAGWEAYSVDRENMRMLRRQDSTIPLIEINVMRAPQYAYRALDGNPALLVRRIAEHVRHEPTAEGVSSLVDLLGSEIVQIKPGVNGIRFVFDAGEARGCGLEFYLGDKRYFIWGYAPHAAPEIAEIEAFMRHVFESVTLPDTLEDFDRPVVDSSQQTAESNARVFAEVERERAMWKLFSERAESERASSLLPAIQHFRKLIRLLAGIRQEESFIAGEDFRRYQRLLKLRRETVREWFVLMEKYRAVKDFRAARRQAKFIVDHATLVGEGLDQRRAAEALARMPDPDAQATQK